MVGSGVESSKMAASWERKEKWGESQVVQFSQNVPQINIGQLLVWGIREFMFLSLGFE